MQRGVTDLQNNFFSLPITRPYRVPGKMPCASPVAVIDRELWRLGQTMDNSPKRKAVPNDLGRLWYALLINALIVSFIPDSAVFR